ncbi:Transcription regulator of multidrug efflux pump operon, TetR family [Citrifermentans bremense]|uniref:Transcription regulator of multidrug efflux pump operon, TetR family n=2 Tax=Citrifermentans bremense TaxID=60035 RepID=A0A6S6M7I8_9BACT|nr:Transcription regulator of multidrug efflux pump operon, TetR family [Citrifermentans bremense]
MMEKLDKRDLIVQAALELVAEQGFHGAPMAMIADKAGVGAGTIYRYFENKDALIRDIYSMVEARVVAAIMKDYPEKGPVRERFMHIGRVLVNYLVSAPLELRFVEQFHNSPFGVDHRREKIFGKGEKDIISELFHEALEQQIFKPLPLSILFALFFSPLIDVCRDQILGFISLDDELIEQIVGACWDAVRR